jgi:hypothetical protein
MARHTQTGLFQPEASRLGLAHRPALGRGARFLPAKTAFRR